MFDASTLQALSWAAFGCGFTWLMTTAGSAVVFFTGKDPEKGKLTHHIFLGFAAGVMIAASVWSLLNPAIEQAEEMGQIGWRAVFSWESLSLWRSIRSCRICMRKAMSPRVSKPAGSARRFWFPL